MTDDTMRLEMPYIKASQSQKEVTHNQALDFLDFYTHTAVENHTLSVPPVSPNEGEIWIVAASATGDWTGKDQQVAQFLHGSWRFFMPFEGQMLWMKGPKYHAVYVNDVWEYGIMRANELRVWGQTTIINRQAAIGNATGGSVIDAEARASLNGLLSICRLHGLIET